VRHGALDAEPLCSLIAWAGADENAFSLSFMEDQATPFRFPLWRGPQGGPPSHPQSSVTKMPLSDPRALIVLGQTIIGVISDAITEKVRSTLRSGHAERPH